MFRGPLGVQFRSSVVDDKPRRGGGQRGVTGRDAGQSGVNTADTVWLQDDREEGGSYDMGLQGSGRTVRMPWLGQGGR